MRRSDARQSRHEMDRRPWIELLRIALEVAATVAFALSGVMMAARKRFDAVGVRGGVCVGLRRRHAARLAAGPAALLLGAAHRICLGILGLSLAAMLFMRQRHFQPTERAMLLPDAIGLGLFAAVGVDIATAVACPPDCRDDGRDHRRFGGVLRDVLCNEVPQAFSDHAALCCCAPLPAAGPMGAAPGGRHRGQPPAGVRADHGWAAGFGAVAQLGAARLAGMNGARPKSRTQPLDVHHELLPP